MKKTSRFKGVCWSMWHGRWKSYIRVGEHRTYLGYYEDEVEAAKAYNAAVDKWKLGREKNRV